MNAGAIQYAGNAPVPITPLLLLFVLFGAAVGTFWRLVRRSTVDRHRLALLEWARDHGFRARPLAADAFPPPIAVIPAAVRVSLTNSKLWLVRLKKDSICWHLLVGRIAGEWIPSGLKPAHQPASIIDELRLSTFPAYSSERFHLLSADSAAARKLSRSVTRALIPADVGLLLWGNWLVLDFSQRPFDPIEFGRMLALAEQVAELLP